jgi:hypothetical protein
MFPMLGPLPSVGKQLPLPLLLLLMVIMVLAVCRQHQDQLLKDHFGLHYNAVVPSHCLMYGNYLVPGAEPKVCRAVPGCSLRK